MDFNITHDGDWVAIAFTTIPEEEARQSRPSSVGVDVMEIRLPHYENSVDEFVNTMDICLTKDERQWIMEGDHCNKLSAPFPMPNTNIEQVMKQEEIETLKRLYTLWTHKEAYTKARGCGLSFDFSRLEVAMWKKDEQTTILRRIQKDNADSRDTNLAGADEQSLAACKFTAIVLPPGQAHMNNRGTEVKNGSGKGGHSLLVTAASRDGESSKQVSNTLDASTAQKSGTLRLWVLPELLREAHQSIQGTLPP